MLKTLIKSRLHSYKLKPKVKQEPNNTKSQFSPNLQTFKQKLISGSEFIEYIKKEFVQWFFS